MRICLCLIAVFVLSCSDSLPEKQCDPDRRCTNTDELACGADGQWYECALVADCHGVAVVFGDGTCETSTPPPPPSTTTNNDINNVSCAQTCAAAGEPNGGVPGCGMVVVTSRDADGCVTSCGCDHPPPPPPQDCAPFEREQCAVDENCVITTDEAGCQTCECESSSCGRMFCNNLCEHGYLIENGCATCECFQPCVGRPECQLACATTNATDPATGCVDSCKCTTDACPGFDCDGACEFGYRRDDNNCEVCECRGRPCDGNEECNLNEVCIGPRTPNNADPGECVELATCDSADDCPEDRPCGFYFRQDCCPPLTTCTADILACPAVCLLGYGDLPRAP